MTAIGEALGISTLCVGAATLVSSAIPLDGLKEISALGVLAFFLYLDSADRRKAAEAQAKAISEMAGAVSKMEASVAVLTANVSDMRRDIEDLKSHNSQQ